MSLENGYFGVALYKPKNEVNIGSLLRTAHIFNAKVFSIIGSRCKKRQASDTTNARNSVPTFYYDSFDEFKSNLPFSCMLVGVELSDSAKNILDFQHPKSAIYLLGAEDHGIPEITLEKCHRKIKIPGTSSLNVAVAGSIVIYDRLLKNFRDTNE